MKSFFIHLSMTLKYTLNPKYWFMTEAYKIRQDYRPQDINKNDIRQMINELESLGHIDGGKASNLYSVINEMSDMELKRVYVRSLEKEESNRDFENSLKDTMITIEEEEQQINSAIDQFLGRFNDKLIQ